MKAIFQKAVVMACVMPALLFSKEEVTSIANFLLYDSELHAQKIFQNDTSRTLVLKWDIFDPKDQKRYTQEPLIEPGGNIIVDFAQALQHLGGNKALFKKKRKYEVTLSLGVAIKVPHRPRMARQIRALKASEKGLRITKKDFVSKDHIVFYKDVSGGILYHAL